MVVPYRLPSAPCTSPAYGLAPSAPWKLCNVVKVCAARVTPLAAHITRTAHFRFHRLILLMRLPPSRYGAVAIDWDNTGQVSRELRNDNDSGRPSREDYLPRLNCGQGQSA